MEIRTYKTPTVPDGVFDITGIFDTPIDVSYSRKFYGGGTFKITVPWGTEYADTLAVGRITLINKTYIGVIDEVTYQASESGRIVTAEGTDILGIAKRILCIPASAIGIEETISNETLTGTTESIIKQIWKDNVIAPPQSWRNPVIGLVLAKNQNRGAQSDSYTTAPDQYISEITGLLGGRAGIGMTQTPDMANGIIIIDVAIGVDRTAGQSAYPPVIFSFDRQTLQSIMRRVSVVASANDFIAAGSSENFEIGAYVVAQSESLYGWERREQYLSVDVTDPLNSGEINGQIDAEKQAYKSADEITFDIDPGRFVIGVDFDVGDYCTVKDKEFGIQADIQIKGITVSATSGGIKYKIEAGIKRQSIFAALRRMIINGR